MKKLGLLIFIAWTGMILSPICGSAYSQREGMSGERVILFSEDFESGSYLHQNESQTGRAWVLGDADPENGYGLWRIDDKHIPPSGEFWVAHSHDDHSQSSILAIRDMSFGGVSDLRLTFDHTEPPADLTGVDEYLQVEITYWDSQIGSYQTSSVYSTHLASAQGCPQPIQNHWNLAEIVLPATFYGMNNVELSFTYWLLAGGALNFNGDGMASVSESGFLSFCDEFTSVCRQPRSTIRVGGNPDEFGQNHS